MPEGRAPLARGPNRSCPRHAWHGIGRPPRPAPGAWLRTLEALRSGGWTALRRALAAAALAVVAAVVVAGCVGSGRLSTQNFDALREAMRAGDYARADALIARAPQDLDNARALDIAIRLGDLAGIRHYLPRTGPDVALDLDATTPLIRAVVDAPLASRNDVARLLLASGATAQRPDRHGRDAIEYAQRRGDWPLAQLLRAPGDADSAAALAPPAFAQWLPADRPGASAAAPPRAPSGAAGRANPRATGRTADVKTDPKADRTANRTGNQKPGAAATRSLEAADLLRRPVWTPRPGADPGAQRLLGVRFSADGTARLLWFRPAGSRFEAADEAYAAWSLERGRLRLAILGPGYALVCATTADSPDELALACFDAQPGIPVVGDTVASLLRSGPMPLIAPPPPSLDGARALLGSFVPAVEPPRPGTSAARVPADEPANEPVARTPFRVDTVLRPAAATLCTPAKRRPAPPKLLPPRVPGDWLAFDGNRFEVHAPMTGRACTQSDARQASLQACARGSKQCVSLGGCPAGQVTAAASYPGVDAGWLACDPSFETARRKALDACRAATGCECQLAAVYGQNLNTARDASCPARR